MANEGLIIDVDYDITKAEAKTRKLNREFEISKQKAENIKNEIKALNDELERSKVKEQEYTAEAERLRHRANEYIKGNLQLTDEQVKKERQRREELERLIEKEQSHQRKTENSIAKQNLALKKQNNTTVDIGDQISLNGKKQNKLSQVFEKSTKSADKFGKRLKSLIASALFFSLVTKAFTALRNEFGKLITETGTKTAALVAKLNENLTVIGKTLYEGLRPHIEWLLEKLVYITQLVANALAKAFGKNINEIKKMTKAAKETEKTLAGFDTLQKIDASKEEGGVPTPQIDIDNEKLEKTKDLLNQIVPLAATLGLIFSAWKITNLLTGLGVIPKTITKIIGGVLLIVTGFAMLFNAAVDWDDSLHNGENTLQAIIGTLGTILMVIGLIILGVTAWPVLIVGALLILGMWFDNFKDKVEKWINSLPAVLYELFDIIFIAAYGVWDLVKNLFKGIFEIFTGDWEKGLKRIGYALLNLIVDAVNIISQALNLIFWPIREIIAAVGRLSGKKWTVNDVSIPKIPRFPQLATGAVLPGGSPMLAWVNDQPKGQPYVEGSIENIAAAFEKYLGDRGLGNQNITIEAKGNWAQFIKFMNLEIKKESKRASIWG